MVHELKLLQSKALTTQQIQTEMDKFDFEVKDVTLSGNNNEIGVVRVVGALDKEEIAEVKDHFSKDFGVEPNVSTVSPTIGKELAEKCNQGCSDFINWNHFICFYPL